MAHVTSNESIQVSGKILGAVYVNYRGGTYIRKAPATRKEARTPAMLLNQDRFSAITRFCIQFKHTLIRQVWNDVATTCSGYNLFMKANSPAFDREGSLAHPLLLKLSAGKLILPEDISVERTAPGATTIRISWIKEASISGTRAADQLMMITSDGQHFSPMSPTGIKRKDVEGVAELPVMPWAARFVYLFFMADDRRNFSDSRVFAV